MKLSIIAGLICIAFAALTVACGGDDDAATNTPGSAATTAASGGDATAANTPKTTTTKTPASGSDDNYQGYFEDLAARFELSRQDSDEATFIYNTDLSFATTLAGQKAVIETFLNSMIGVFDDSILTMNGFDPPSEAEDAHFTFRDDIVQAKAMSETLKDDLDDAVTADDVVAVTNAFDLQVGALVNHAQAACRDLQEIADEKNINEDLDCNPA